MSSDQRIFLISAEPSERSLLDGYFKKHGLNFRTFKSLEAAEKAIGAETPDVFVLAGSRLSSRSICEFGARIEKATGIRILAVLTRLQVSLVTELAVSDNFWTIEYPLSLRELRESIQEAFQALEQA